MSDLTEAELDELERRERDRPVLLALISLAREALAGRLSRALDTGKWQPIETAPLDRPILIWDGVADQVELVWWNQKCSEYGTWASHGVSGFNPTHWMPLPTPPTAPQERCEHEWIVPHFMTLGGPPDPTTCSKCGVYKNPAPQEREDDDGRIAASAIIASTVNPMANNDALTPSPPVVSEGECDEPYCVRCPNCGWQHVDFSHKLPVVPVAEPTVAGRKCEPSGDQLQNGLQPLCVAELVERLESPLLNLDGMELGMFLECVNRERKKAATALKQQAERYEEFDRLASAHIKQQAEEIERLRADIEARALTIASLHEMTDAQAKAIQQLKTDIAWREAERGNMLKEADAAMLEIVRLRNGITLK